MPGREGPRQTRPAATVFNEEADFAARCLAGSGRLAHAVHGTCVQCLVVVVGLLTRVRPSCRAGPLWLAGACICLRGRTLRASVSDLGPCPPRIAGGLLLFKAGLGVDPLALAGVPAGGPGVLRRGLAAKRSPSRLACVMPPGGGWGLFRHTPTEVGRTHAWWLALVAAWPVGPGLLDRLVAECRRGIGAEPGAGYSDSGRCSELGRTPMVLARRALLATGGLPRVCLGDCSGKGTPSFSWQAVSAAAQAGRPAVPPQRLGEKGAGRRPRAGRR